MTFGQKRKRKRTLALVGVFDKDYNVIEGKKLQISEAGKFTVGNETVGNHEYLQIDPITISEEGYIYIYLSNQTPNSEVYFDDLYIRHTQSRVIQKEDYYPFGLSISELSTTRENIVEQNWKFQGQEHQTDFDLNWYAFKWRMHNPEIGRFMVIDPLSEDYYYNSPYTFSENKVTAHVELEGLEAVSAEIMIDIRNTDPKILKKRKERYNKIHPSIKPGSSFSKSHMKALSKGTGIEHSNFIEYASDRSLEEIITMITPSEENDLSSAVQDDEFQDNRYIKDPGNPEIVIDMRHFIGVGGKYGTAIGVVIEDIQELFNERSGGNPQDYYSNNLGADFFKNHYNPDSDSSFAEQLNEYFRQRAEEYEEIKNENEEDEENNN